jgi:hypothetical protein
MKGMQCKHLQELTNLVADNATYPGVAMLSKRKTFGKHVSAFHRDARIPLHWDYNGIVLMTAHQPNLFPYSGVVRKAVLVHAVAEKLRDSLGCPVTELFCFADQDFASERWFKEAQLPSIRNREGILSLHLSIPDGYDNKILRTVPKPDLSEIEGVKNEIQRWATSSREGVIKHSRLLGIGVPEIASSTRFVFDVIDRANERSHNAADFNAFFLAYLVEECGYQTAFARFSECQQVFAEEIAYLLENTDRYQKVRAESGKESGEAPHAPIWYHCHCDGKADVDVEAETNHALIAKCRACGTTFKFEGSLPSALQQMLPNVSLRAEAMLIAFSGIGVTFYVAGEGGVAYLTRADKIAQALGVQFPVVATWRPKDVYGGIGQLDAILELLRVTYQYNLANNDDKCAPAVAQSKMDDIVADIDGAISALENLKRTVANRKVDSSKEKIMLIASMQNQLRKQLDRSAIARDRSIVANTEKTLGLMPSIIDHIVNMGMQSTVAQWSAALTRNMDFREKVSMRTNSALDALFEATKQMCVGDLFE